MLYDFGVILTSFVAQKARNQCFEGFSRHQISGVQFPYAILVKQKFPNFWVDKDSFFKFRVTEI
jgi:hypothetical protein